MHFENPHTQHKPSGFDQSMPGKVEGEFSLDSRVDLIVCIHVHSTIIFGFATVSHKLSICVFDNWAA